MKTTGGELGGNSGMDGNLVSFYKIGTKRFETPDIRLGYGKKEGFEYPVTFGVGQRNFSNLACYNAGNPVLAGLDHEVLRDIKNNLNHAKTILTNIKGVGLNILAAMKFNVFPSKTRQNLINFIREKQINSEEELEKFAKELVDIILSDNSWIKIEPNSAHTTIATERTVNQFFPLHCIDYIFAPPFAVAEIEDLVKEWKLDIKVMSYPAQK
jgi:hypothetical protein